MTKIKRHFRVLVAYCLLLGLPAMAVLAVTPAGTKITVTSTAQYTSSKGIKMPDVTSNAVVTTVGQVASVGVAPSSANKSVVGTNPAVFGLSVRNTGNGSDTFKLSATAQYGSSVLIYKDDNGDGLRQPTETTQVTSSGSLTMGEEFKCLVVAQLPSSGSIPKDTITFTATSVFDSTKSAKSTLTLETEQVGYIRSWLLNGYYAYDDPMLGLTADYLGGECRVGPTEGAKTAGRDWFRIDSATDRIDLAKAFGGPTRCVAYAHTYVYAPKAQQAVILLGSDDGARVWLNETQVWMNRTLRSLSPDQDRIPVELNQGWNKLLLKISQGFGYWAFTARIVDPEGNSIPGLLAAAVPNADSSGPTISNVAVNPANVFARVTWETDEPSTTIVEYQPSSSSNAQSVRDDNLTTQHKSVLPNLLPNTDYTLKVGSVDAAGNVVWSSPQAFRTTDEPIPAFAQDWLVNGYYRPADPRLTLAIDFLGAEPLVVASEGDIVGDKAWVKVPSIADALDLGRVFGFPVDSAAYAYVCIYSPATQPGVLLLGSDDGVKIWLNGELIWTNETYRRMIPDQDSVPITLSKGWNRLLVKISQGGGAWRLAARITDPKGNPIPGLFFFAP